MRPNKFPFFSFAALGNRIRRKGVASPRTPVWDQEFLVAIGGGDDDASDYAANAVAYRCVKLVAESAASERPDVVVRRDERTRHPSRRPPRPATSGGENSDQAAVAIADLLRRPAPNLSGEEFLETLHSHLQLRGNAYVRAVSIAGEVRELHPLRPERCRVVRGDDGRPRAVVYSAAGRDDAFNLNAAEPEVLHLKSLNPGDDVYGIAPMHAARKAVALHNAADAWNKSLLDNSARPSGALVYAPKRGGGQLTTQQFEQLRDQLDAAFTGGANAGRPLILEGGMDWRQMGHSPKDMDFVGIRHAAARDVALAFGVPPMLLGIPGDNTYANYAEANRSFWRHTVMPAASRVANALVQWLAPSCGENPADVVAVLRGDGGGALAAEQESLWRRLDNASFLTEREKRVAVGYPPAPDDDHAEDQPRRADQPADERAEDDHA